MDRRTFFGRVAVGGTGLGVGGSLAALTVDTAPAVLGRPALDVMRDRLLALDSADMPAQVRAWVAAGASFRDLLGATLLAGVHEVNPSPIGGQVHAMMMVPSAAAATVRLPAADLWLPALFNVNRLKNSQGRDAGARRSDWTMAKAPAFEPQPVAERIAAFERAMSEWDAAAADRAVTALHAVTSLHDFFELLWPHAARDFRVIGHKIIYATQTYRALADLGWRYGRDPVRSVTLGVLDQNPYGNFDDAQTKTILGVHAANAARAATASAGWRGGAHDPHASFALLATLRACDPDAAAQAIVDGGARGLSATTLWDGVRLRAFEIALQHPDIAGMHPVTSVNALHYAARASAVEVTQKLMLLQAASWMAMFRDALQGRGTATAAKRSLDEWEKSDRKSARAGDPFALDEREAASTEAARLLRQEGGMGVFTARAVAVLARKAQHDHDYKFAVAAIEEIELAHPACRPVLAAAAMVLLRTDADSDGPAPAMAQRI